MAKINSEERVAVVVLLGACLIAAALIGFIFWLYSGSGPIITFGTENGMVENLVDFSRDTRTQTKQLQKFVNEKRDKEAVEFCAKKGGVYRSTRVVERQNVSVDECLVKNTVYSLDRDWDGYLMTDWSWKSESKELK